MRRQGVSGAGGVLIGTVVLGLAPRPLAAQPVSTHGAVTQQSGRQVVIQMDSAYAVSDTATGRIWGEDPSATPLARFAVRSASASVVIARVTGGDAESVQRGQRATFSSMQRMRAKRDSSAILFTTTPPGAAVQRVAPEEGGQSGNGAEPTRRTLGTTPTAVFLPVGANRLRFRKAGRFPVERRITVRSDTTRRSSAIRTVEVELGAARPGSLIVDTTPDSATVYVDSAEVGTGEATAVAEGSHRIRVAAPGYQPRSTTVSVEAGQRRSVSLPLSRERGSLRVTSSPSGAVVFVDGKRVGQTTLETQQPVGEHTIRIEKEGFAPIERTLSLTTDGQALSLALPQPLRVESTSEQGAFVQNVELERDGERLLVRYALPSSSDAAEAYDVALKLSRDGGATYDDIPGQWLKGNVGRGVSPGARKEIRWNALGQYPNGLSGNGHRLQVVAEASASERYPSRTGFFIESYRPNGTSPVRETIASLGGTHARFGFAGERITFAFNAARRQLAGDYDQLGTIRSSDSWSVGPELGVLLLEQGSNGPIALHSSVTFLYTRGQTLVEGQVAAKSYSQRQLVGRARAYHTFSLSSVFDVVPQVRATPVVRGATNREERSTGFSEPDGFSEPEVSTPGLFTGALGFFLGTGDFGVYLEAGIPFRALSSSVRTSALTLRGGLHF
jgi:hypothetical protein